MEKLHFETFIKATPEKVWNTMLEDRNYRAWTSAFNPHGSWFEGDWSLGSSMKFLGPNPSKPEEIGGMVSRITDNQLHKFLSIEHLGEIQNGVEDTTSDRAKMWAGAHENYTFTEENGGTRIAVDLEMGSSDSQEVKDMVDMFKGMWPNALEKLKEIAEK